ncbi:MAG: anthranilate phosphoribosyltransferase [Nitrospirota bacterium]|nr:anthranilate phosphoribosyltransferase [Nitrospirota bacterium]
MTIAQGIAKVIDGADLSADEAADVMRQIMSGEATQAQIGAFLVALRMKGEAVAEIVGSARVMREFATAIRVDDPLVVDTCGTGGDKSGSFNISTTSAFVVAGGGITVAKHGNRSVSSRSGSADVLIALGVNVEAKPEVVERCVNDVGIGFLFAPLFHGAMKHAIGPRREIGVRSIFNILGPLTNPAGASVQVLGVYAEALTDTLARVLVELGSRHCFVVHGSDGLDEITTTGPSRVAEGIDGVVSAFTLTPQELGLALAKPQQLAGGDAARNAEITRAVLAGEKGPARDIVLLNAAPLFVATGKSPDLKQGVKLAAESIDSGAAAEKLRLLVEASHR